MRNVVLYHLISIDGVAEEPSAWMFDFDTAAATNLGTVIARQDAVLLGRTSYDEWAGYWPTSDIEPFASFINNTTKYVFSARPQGLSWANSTFVDTSAVEFVRDLKTQAGGDIGVHASIALSRSLLRAGLVDEIQLVIAPALAGTGRRLFEDDTSLQRMELVSLSRSPAGIVFAAYRTATSQRGLIRMAP